MDFLVNLFHTVVTYPNLNILVWLYQLTHNFALAIMLFSGMGTVFFTWPAGYLDELTHRREREAKAGVHPGLIALYPWRYAGKNQARLALATVILSFFGIYTTCGIWFALAMLGGLSVEALNNVLYAVLPPMTALPDYDMTIWGQTTSLTQSGFPLPFLVAIAFATLVQSYFKAGHAARVSGKGSRWSRFAPTFAWDCALNVFITLALSWLFAAGAVLDWTTDAFLKIPLRVYVVQRSRR